MPKITMQTSGAFAASWLGLTGATSTWSGLLTAH
jgi:hypothetical protein